MKPINGESWVLISFQLVSETLHTHMHPHFTALTHAYTHTRHKTLPALTLAHTQVILAHTHAPTHPRSTHTHTVRLSPAHTLTFHGCVLHGGGGDRGWGGGFGGGGIMLHLFLLCKIRTANWRCSKPLQKLTKCDNNNNTNDATTLTLGT